MVDQCRCFREDTITVLLCLRWLSFKKLAPNLPNLAASKLVNAGGPFTVDSFQTKNMQQVLAVLSSRIRLETIVNSAEATEINDTAVASHMRILTGVSPDSTIRHATTPSEPILALGATTVLLSKSSHYPEAIETLARQLVASYIDVRRFGEAVARLAMTCARDFRGTKESSASPDFITPVSFLEFLNTLLGGDWGLLGLQAEEKKEFETKFANAYVNFTHWTKTNDNIDRNTDMCILVLFL